MKKYIAAALAAALLLSVPAYAAGAPAVEAGACVLMEKETGSLLYESNAHQAMEPASVTKVMTMLLTMEAIDSGRLNLDDMVIKIGRAHV